MTNLILNTDSYKASQYCQYPPGTTEVYSHVLSRGGEYDKVVFFGLQMFLQEYLTKPVTTEHINEAERVLSLHGLPFNRKGWEYIVENHSGLLPLEIMAVKEGSVVGTKNVLATIRNTDPECFWLTSYIETTLLRAIWYPTTVATNSYNSKKIILKYLEKNGDPAGIDFKLHDFGARGVSSLESAGIGGLAHLVNFQGTDTLTALLYASEYYFCRTAGFSIPAMEHSTVTSWGKEGEFDSFTNMMDHYATPGSIYTCVSDSYDIYQACERWGTEMKQKIIDSGATLVIRPDSGDPVEVVSKVVRILDSHFGSTINSKGYKVLNHVRVIQGDGITAQTIEQILKRLDEDGGYSADNVAFGQGGALLQQVNRDTLKFAMKCSSVTVNGEERQVFKDPITDKGKSSYKGKLALIKNDDGSYSTVEDKPWVINELEPVFLNGKIKRLQSLTDIRKIVNSTL